LTQKKAVLFEAERLYLRILEIDRDNVHALKNLAALYQNNAAIFAEKFWVKRSSFTKILQKVKELHLKNHR